MGIGDLSLAAALKSGRLEDFIRQEEARGVRAIERADWEAALAKLLQDPKQMSKPSQVPVRNKSSTNKIR